MAGTDPRRNPRTGGSPQGRAANAQPRRPEQRAQGAPRLQGSPRPRDERHPQAERRPQGEPRPQSDPRRAQRAASQAMQQRSPSARRRGARGRNYTYYYILIFAVFAVVFVVLANTVLFRCVSFEVEGAGRYSAEEIIAASGLKKGDNLLHISAAGAEKAVVGSLAYIDSAQVKKRFPTKIKIIVEESEKWFAVVQDGKTAIVSRGGKIIDSAADSSIVQVTGYEAKSLDVGGILESEVTGKNGIPEELLEAADKAGLSGISAIDMTDRFSLVVSCGSRITLELGNISDIETKLNIAAGVIKSEISPTDEVILNLVDPDKVVCRFANAGGDLPELPPVPAQTEESAQSAESAESA